MYLYMYIYMCACIYIHVYVYVYVYTCSYLCVVGASYVFREGASGWTALAILLAAQGKRGDRFGTAVSLANDTLVVGAPNENSFTGR